MKFTKEEKNWILYDIGNSAFTMLMTSIMPIYFNYLAESGGLSEVEYMAYWGYTASIATLSNLAASTPGSPLIRRADA